VDSQSLQTAKLEEASSMLSSRLEATKYVVRSGCEIGVESKVEAALELRIRRER